MKISSTQILQIIEQYLKQENLIKTLECLQTESGVILDAQSTILKKNIEKGNWMEVMDGLMYVDLPPKLLAPLYEQMILELVESGNIESAAELFHNSEPIEYLENHNESRFAQIKLLMNRFDSKLAYGNRTPIQIRKTLAKDLESILEPPSDDDRLLTLVGQALEYQMGVGKINRSSHYDAYLDKVLDQGETPISPVCNLEHQTKFAKKENPEAAAFSPNGKFFCIGTFDGFLEVWDPNLAQCERI